MKTIAERLHKLEERFGLQPETEFDRRLPSVAPLAGYIIANDHRDVNTL